MGNDQKAERRAHPRTKIGLEVLCSSRREEGTAMLKDLSVSGALLETAIRLAVGDSVTIWFQADPKDEPCSFHTRVVRHTPDGFAVEFAAPYSVVHDIIAKYRDAVDAPHT